MRTSPDHSSPQPHAEDSHPSVSAHMERSMLDAIRQYSADPENPTGVITYIDDAETGVQSGNPNGDQQGAWHVGRIESLGGDDLGDGQRYQVYDVTLNNGVVGESHSGHSADFLVTFRNGHLANVSKGQGH